MENPGEGGQYGSTGQTNNVSSKKLQQTHAQVNEVVDIMRDNVEKVIDRDVKLSELDDRADALQQGASQFETQAAKLKRKYWWKNMKMWILLIVVCAIVLGVFFLNTKEPAAQPNWMARPPQMNMPMYEPQQPVMNQGAAAGAGGVDGAQVGTGSVDVEPEGQSLQTSNAAEGTSTRSGEEEMAEDGSEPVAETVADTASLTPNANPGSAPMSNLISDYRIKRMIMDRLANGASNYNYRNYDYGNYRP